MIPIDPPPLEDPSRCQLLGPTALAVQAAMGVIVIASLVVKRQFEKRKRPWRIWIFDVGKQLVGQAVLHGANLLISGLIAEGVHNSPCSTFFLNILIDCTIGVAILYFALKGCTLLTERYTGLILKSGYYGDPPQWVNWWRQLIPYMGAVIIMKVFVILPLTLPGISTLLLRFGHAAIEYLSPDFQVIFVMMIFPLIMNVIQGCLVDQVIKAGKIDELEEDGYEPLDDGVPKTEPNSPVLVSARSRLSQDLERDARRSLSPEARTLAPLGERLSLSRL